MKLVFRKNDQEEITVLQSCDGKERPFVYTDMIKALIKDGKLELPVIDGSFTEEEKHSINKMINEINRETMGGTKASGVTEEPL